MALRATRNANRKRPLCVPQLGAAPAHWFWSLVPSGLDARPGLDAFNGAQRGRNRFEQRIAGKGLEQNGEGFRVARQLTRGFVEATGDHDPRQPASGRGEGFAELYPIHLGKMYIDYQASVGFGKVAVEDG